MTTLDRPPVPEPPAPPRRRDRTHWLYIAVVIAVLAGIAVGLVAPDVGKSVGVLGTMFVSLIKMMITPVIFCTIVLGIGSVRKAATVGKVGGLAFVYFLVMSTFALAIGLVVGNLIHPGSGMHLTPSTATKGAELAEKAHESGGLMDFVQHIIPTSLLSSLTEGNVLQALFVALLVGFALQAMGGAGQPILRGIEHLQKLVFKILVMILWLAPIGAFGAIANVVGQTGWSAVTQLLTLMLAFYITCVVFVFGVLGSLLRVVSGVSIFKLVRYPRPRVPADLLDLVLGVGTAAADRQDGAPWRRPQHRRSRCPDRLFVQPGRHRHLPDHGIAVHCRRDGQPAVGRSTDRAVAVHDGRVQGCRRCDGRRAGHAGRRPAEPPS